MADAKAAIEAWRIDYNTGRPYSSLEGATPYFAMTTEGSPAGAGSPVHRLKTRGFLTIRVTEKGQVISTIDRYGNV